MVAVVWELVVEDAVDSVRTHGERGAWKLREKGRLLRVLDGRNFRMCYVVEALTSGSVRKYGKNVNG